MALGAKVLRELDPAERYYWLLSRLSATNIVAIAELDRVLPRDALVFGLASVQRRHPLLRASIEEADGQLVFVETAANIPVTHISAQGSEWIATLESELDTPFEPSPAPLVRCVHIATDGAERSFVLLTVQHALADARSAVVALQQILRQVEGPTDSEVTAPLPPPLHDRIPPEWRAARGALDVLTAIRGEREDLPPATTFAFHDRGAADQSSRVDMLTIEARQTKALRAEGRRGDATMQGVLGAAVLNATAALFDQPEDRVLFLATPTDLRQRVDPALPADTVMLAIGLLCTPYRLQVGENPSLAHHISQQTQRELTRGESHLFYRFARAGAFAPTEDGIAAFAASMTDAPANIAVSNLGVVNDEGDPSWVRSLSFALSTTSNQPAFVAATTYRDRLTVNIATDRSKMAPGLADQLTEGISRRLVLRR
jgi:hypothetical protein